MQRTNDRLITAPIVRAVERRIQQELDGLKPHAAAEVLMTVLARIAMTLPPAKRSDFMAALGGYLDTALETEEKRAEERAERRLVAGQTNGQTGCEIGQT
jgi:hypothetical protein